MKYVRLFIAVLLFTGAFILFGAGLYITAVSGIIRYYVSN